LLSSALPDLTTNINIQGPGAEHLTVFRSSAIDFRIFNVTTTGTAAFSGMTISDGSATLATAAAFETLTELSTSPTASSAVTNLTTSRRRRHC
jgi:hypothetical protein